MSEGVIKKDNGISAKYGALVLYRRDFEALFSCIRAAAPDAWIETDEYRFSDTESYFKDFEVVKGDLVITAQEPFFMLHIERSGCRIRFHSKNDASKKLYCDIDEILKRAERPLQFLYAEWFWAVLYVLFPLAWVGVGFAMHVSFIVGISGSVVTPFVFLFCLFIVAYSTSFSRALVCSVNPSDRTTFFQRKKDDIIILVLGAIIGVFFTLVAQLLFPEKSDPTTQPSQSPQSLSPDSLPHTPASHPPAHAQAQPAPPQDQIPSATP